MAFQFLTSVPAFPDEDRRERHEPEIQGLFHPRVNSDRRLTNLCQGATADSREAKPTITIHVYNYADVSPKTMVKAEEVAPGIFRTAVAATSLEKPNCFAVESARCGRLGADDPPQTNSARLGVNRLIISTGGSPKQINSGSERSCP